MIKTKLKLALDFEGDEDVPHQKATKLIDGTWYVFLSGPTYSNTYEVTKFDAAGLKLLQAHEVKDEEPKPTD